MDFPEVDHNPLMDYPGSMSEILVCCLDTAPRASDQGEFEPSADFLCWLCPFTGRVSCSSAGGEGLQRKSPSLAKQQEGCAERRGWEPLNPTSHPEPPRPQSPTLGTRHTKPSWLLSGCYTAGFGLSQTTHFLCSQVFPQAPGSKSASSWLFLITFISVTETHYPSGSSTLRWWH